jgi:hypothetical protein
MTAKIRMLRHTTPGRLLAEIGAELGSPILEFGQLGLQAPDLAVDARQLRPGLLFADVTVAVPGPGEGSTSRRSSLSHGFPCIWAWRYCSVPASIAS